MKVKKKGMLIHSKQNNRLKFLCLALCIGFANITVSAQKKISVTFVEDQTFAENELPYTPNCLQWNLFRSTISNEASHSANTVTNSAFGMSTLSDEKSIKVEVHTNFYFDKNASSKKQGITSTYLLQHEQLHFDIAFQGYQQFLAELKTIQVNENNYATIYETAFNNYRAKVREAQLQYDTETEHGINQLQQELWTTKVQKNLLFLPVINKEIPSLAQTISPISMMQNVKIKKTKKKKYVTKF
jgi:hypothetical protein